VAFATIKLKSKNGAIKEAPVGFSWTTFFVSAFVPLFRGDWTWALIMLIASFITFGLAGILFAFIYNRLYIEGLLKQGYAVISYWGDKKEIESNIQLILNNFIDNNELIKFEIDTPNEMEKKYNTSGGHWHHGDMEIDQLLMIRPFYGSAQYETPINGLYICGAGTHPGGGITGINAINASKQLLKK